MQNTNGVGQWPGRTFCLSAAIVGRYPDPMMDFATPLLLFALFLGVGHGLVTFTRLRRVFPGRSAMIWSMAFAIGALGSTMSFGMASLAR